MNYYERHLGDYARDTGHLTPLEHGVYTLLLDRYYATEEGIPNELIFKISRARTKEEKLATETVLGEFFYLQDGVWISVRAEQEIAKARIRIGSAKKNGKKGGRPKKNPVGYENETQQKPDGLSLGSETETGLKAHQAPSTSKEQELPTTSGADTPNDPPADPIWGTGLAFLLRKGIPEPSARALLGKVRKAAGDVEAGAILARAEAEDVTNPAPWILTAASNAKAREGPSGSAGHGKTMGAILALEGMKNGLDETRITNGLSAPAYARLG